MNPNNLFTEEPVSWQVDDIEVQATLTRPAGEGPFPAVIFVAGSGPTDRNWTTPLLPGSNGSGGLLARALCEHGFITLRYDKRASGPHIQEHMKRLAGKISMQGHVAELAGGVKLLYGTPEVDPAKIFVLTNSEGCVHALNYQTQAGNFPFAGMVLTSPFARATGELARSQIATQLTPIPGGDALLSAYDAAITAFLTGQPVPPSETLPAGLQQVIQAVTAPINQPFSHELWIFNPLEKLAEITIPVFIVLGKKDIQVDWQTDGALFETVAQGHANITLTYFENANHVLKFEPKPREQLNPAEVTVSYGADDTLLDQEPVDTITAWLQAHLKKD
jgi:alpha-beta hydrolase superfamily lysophospholipase